LKVVELSDAQHGVSWELIESIPSLSVLGVIHTIKLRRVTDVNQTFIEWTTDFSSDASQQVIQDARFKQLDHFKALIAAVGGAAESKDAPAKKLIGGTAGVFDINKAREGVVQIWTELQSLQKAANDSASLNHQSLTALVQRYKALPTSWSPNWSYAGLTGGQTQEVADDVRNKLNAARARLGDNGLPLPRLFHADA